jgi:hypothetical protein
VTVEEWAGRIIEKELNRRVVVHDDGSKPGMYDLRIGDAEAPDVAIECVRAVDPVRAETWSVGPGRGSFHLTEVNGDWMINIRSDARINKIKQRIGPLLQDLEERGIRRVSVWRPSEGYEDRTFEELKSLGVRYAAYLNMPETGKVHWTMEGNGGFVDTEGSVLPEWIGTFLRDPEREDVLSKLRRTDAQERWVFVPIVFGGAPWSVESYLTDEFEHLPATSPNLPPPVTGVWVTSTFGTHGVRWDGAGWHLFRVKEESSAP